MHLRISTRRRASRLYRYAQLVESYRREKDGMPAHRVVANLGTLSEQQIANFKLALAASRRRGGSIPHRGRRAIPRSRRSSCA